MGEQGIPLADLFRVTSRGVRQSERLLERPASNTEFRGEGNCMRTSKFVRTLSALLMLLALVLPVAPAAGATVGDQDDVHAANVLGTPANPAVDAQDCLGQGQTNPQ